MKERKDFNFLSDHSNLPLRHKTNHNLQIIKQHACLKESQGMPFQTLSASQLTPARSSATTRRLKQQALERQSRPTVCQSRPQSQRPSYVLNSFHKSAREETCPQHHNLILVGVVVRKLPKGDHQHKQEAVGGPCRDARSEDMA